MSAFKASDGARSLLDRRIDRAISGYYTSEKIVNMTANVYVHT